MRDVYSCPSPEVCPPAFVMLEYVRYDAGNHRVAISMIFPTLDTGRWVLDPW